MKTASVTESKNELSRLLRRVRAGHSVLIMDRDVPVARLEPVAGDTIPDAPRLAALERQGLLRRNRPAAGMIARLKQLPAPKVKTGASAVAALLADRGEPGR